MPTHQPTFVAIGHVSWDATPEHPDARQPGGAAAYATVLARRLGVDAAIITAAALDDGYPLIDVAPASHRRLRPSASTTAFENSTASDGVRHQRLLTRAADLRDADVPDAWRRPDILFAGPLTQELAPDCLDWFEPRLSCIVPQGWCRTWSGALPASVELRPTPPEGTSTAWDICVISEHETRPDTLADWRNVSQHLVVTHGDRGATLFRPGDKHGAIVPPVTPDAPQSVVDTTGAGDVFAAAMTLHHARHGDALAAAAYGAEWAARCVTAPSWLGIA